jgi:hypothetical protein
MKQLFKRLIGLIPLLFIFNVASCSNTTHYSIQIENNNGLCYKIGQRLTFEVSSNTKFTNINQNNFYIRNLSYDIQNSLQIEPDTFRVAEYKIFGAIEVMNDIFELQGDYNVGILYFENNGTHSQTSFYLVKSPIAKIYSDDYTDNGIDTQMQAKFNATIINP